jgi:hypothetical protein
VASGKKDEYYRGDGVKKDRFSHAGISLDIRSLPLCNVQFLGESTASQHQQIKSGEESGGDCSLRASFRTQEESERWWL